MKKSITLFIVLALVVALSACGGQTANTPTPEASQKPDVNTEDVIETTEPTEPSPAEPAITPLHLWETVKTDSYEITVTEAVIHTSANHSVYIGGLGVQVDLKVKNLTKQEFKLSAINVTADYNEGFIYQTTETKKGYQTAYGWKETFAPLEEKSYTFVIDAPKEAVSDFDSSLYVIVEMPNGEKFSLDMHEDIPSDIISDLNSKMDAVGDGYIGFELIRSDSKYLDFPKNIVFEFNANGISAYGKTESQLTSEINTMLSGAGFNDWNVVVFVW